MRLPASRYRAVPALLTALLVAAAGCASPQERDRGAIPYLTVEQAAAFKNVKTLRLVVREAYEGCPGLSLPAVKDLARRMADAAPVALVESGESAADATLTIETIGTLKREKPDAQGRESACADLGGTLMLAAGPVTYARPLTNVTHAYHGFVGTEAPDPKNTYDQALWETNFVKALAETMSLAGAGDKYRLLVASLGGESWWGRNPGKHCLIRAGRAAVPALLAALQGEAPGEKDKVIDILGEIGDPRAVEPLIAALEDEVLVGPAAEALGKIRDRRAVPHLVRLVTGATEESGAWQAAEALGRIPDRRAIGPLIAALTGPDAAPRGAAASALEEYLDAPERLRLATSQPWANEGESYECLRGSAYLRGAHLPPTKEELGPLIAQSEAQAAAVQQTLAAAFRQALVEMKDPRRVALAFGALPTYVSFDWARVKAGKVGRGAMAPLLTVLKDKDPRVRAGAAVALGKIGDPATCEPVAALLKDADPAVRIRAARALADIGDTKAVDPLVRALKRTRIKVQGSRCGNQADPEWEPASYAAWALGRLKDPRAVEPLLAALKIKEADSHFRMFVAEALGRIGDPQAIPALIDLWRAEDFTIGWADCAARLALVRIGRPAIGPLIAALREERCRIDAGLTLADFGDAVIDPLMEAYRAGDREMREVVIDVLGSLKSDRATDCLLEMLKDKDPDVRQQVFFELHVGGGPRAVAPLLAILQDKSETEDTRNAALCALITLADRRCIKPLAKILLEETSDVLVPNAGSALGNIPDPKVVELLLACLKSNPDRLRRMAAAGGLRGAEDARTAEALLAALRDPDAGVRVQAVESLGQRGEVRALAALGALAEKDPEEYVRRAAREAAQNIRQKVEE